MSASSPSLRRALAGLAAVGLVACAVPLAVAIHSVGGHHRDLIAVFGPLIGGASIGTGLLAWQRRPENRFGALLVAVGFTLLPVRADRLDRLVAVHRRAAS